MIWKTLILVLCAAFAAKPLYASEPAPEYPAEAFFNTTDFYLSDLYGSVSPDGDRLLTTSNKSGIFNVYELDVASGEATSLTASDSDAAVAISYFPDGERFIYSADSGGDELTHIYVSDVAGDGAPVDLTPGDNVKASFGGWIEDGAAFTISTNERDPRYFDLYRVEAASLERSMVFRNDGGFSNMIVSRDGQYLALMKPRNSADNDIYLTRIGADEDPQLITAHEGNISHRLFTFQPDSSALIYGTNAEGEFTQAWRHDLNTGEQTPYLEADWDVVAVNYSPSGRYRVHGVNADGSTRASIYDTRRKRWVAMPKGLPDGDVASIRFFSNENEIAFLLIASNAPANVYIADLGKGAFRRLTDALNPEIDPAHLAQSRVVRYPSYDGLEIPSILTKPLHASKENKTPAVVFVHGGPGGQSRLGYSAMVQHLVNHGYTVLAANNRGSSGYGKTFFHMDDKKHGDVDLRDIVEAKHWLAEQEWVDADNIAVMGGSYGGYITMAALAFHPDVFDAGINIFGVTNWVRTLQSIPPWWEAFKEALYDEMGDPATDAERHRAISPLFHAENITKPVLVVQGTNDPRVLQIESDEMVAAIEANGVPVDYLLFPDEGHGFLKRENRIAASDRYVEFLDRYLKSEAE